MLRVPLRELGRGSVDTTGRLAPDDPLFDGLDFGLADALEVRGRLQSTAAGEVFWRATVSGRAQAPCRRCLVEVEVPIAIELDILFSADPETAEDPSVYPMPDRATHLDVRTAVREEVVLAIPSFLLCREDCAGLCPQCGTDLNAEACACTASARHV